MKHYEVKVVREGRWWMVEIPELDGLTQARRLAEAPEMAREWIALNEDVALSEVEVEVVSVDAAGLDVAAAGSLVSELRSEIGQLEDVVAQVTSSTAKALSADGVPMRDIAEILGLSYQRIGQLVGEPDRAAAELQVQQMVALGMILGGAYLNVTGDEQRTVKWKRAWNQFQAGLATGAGPTTTEAD